MMLIISIFIRVMLIVLFVTVSAECEEEILISGRTMGTTYHIKVVSSQKTSDILKEKIDRRLNEINQSMSTYLKDSEISRFNALNRTGEKFFITKDFLDVMLVAQEIYKMTKGAWDGTVDPLVDLWGFGRSIRENRIPDVEKIKAALSNVGFDNIVISTHGYLIKNNASVSLDLASIAKGYGVDQISKVIEETGIRDFLVEIGGEVKASGLKPDRRQWKVGLNQPRKDAAPDEVYRVVTLNNKALATSGDYRNFFELNGKRYSHIIDPRTGYPVSNSVVSASVIAKTCTFADGLATALMVMGHKKGTELVNSLSEVESLIVVEQKDGKLNDYISSGWAVNDGQ